MFISQYTYMLGLTKLIFRLGSKSARFARALTFLAPAECFYGYSTLSVTTIQIQHEFRVGRSPDLPKAEPRSEKAKPFKTIIYCCTTYCYIVILNIEHLHSIVFTYYVVQLRMKTLCLSCCLAKKNVPDSDRHTTFAHKSG